MKPALILSLASLVLASPVPIAEPIPDVNGNLPDLHTERSAPALLSERQSTTGITSNEFTLLGCRPIIFLFARGSAEVGNMGSTVGPPTSNGIKSAFGVTNVATEGIDYPALLSTNLLPGGADPNGIATMKNLINEAAECSGSKIVVAGYSQGAALVHRAVENLSQSVMDKIVAAVTYGDTQNLQDGGRIPNFPPEKTLIICNAGDAVCAGTLTITPAHLDYVPRVPEALAFIDSKLSA